jgi:hypothetical protein
MGGVSRPLGKGGRKSGMWNGGCQFDVRGRLRAGDDGLDIGESGKVGVKSRLLFGGSVFRP